MNTKIISFFLLFLVSYLLAIFFLPKETDEMAAFLGFLQVNESIRSLKSSSDNLAEGIVNPKYQLTESSGGTIKDIGSNTIETVDGYTESIQSTVKNARDVIQIKKQQAENLSNTIQKGTEVIGELQQNTNALLEFSGSSLLNSGSTGSTNNQSNQLFYENINNTSVTGSIRSISE